MALLTTDTIISGRLIQLLGHLELENLSIVLDSIGRARMVQQLRIGGGVRGGVKGVGGVQCY